MSSQFARRVPARFLARLGALAGTVVAVSVCGTQDRLTQTGPTGPGTDATPPTLQLVLPTDTLVEIADSLKFTVNARDESRLASVHVGVSGLGSFALALSKDTAFAAGSTVTLYAFADTVPLPTNAAGQRIAISATATDGSGNTTTFTDTVRVNDTQAPVVTMLTPAAGVAVGTGDTIHILARAADPSGVRYLGARLFLRDTVLGRIQSKAVDSLVYTSRQSARLDSLQIVVPTTLAPGSYVLQAFAADSSPLANKGASPDLAVAVRDIRAPTGSFNTPAVDAAIVAGDTLSLSFHATDNVGVASVQFRGYALRTNALGGPPDTVVRYQAQTALFALHPADTNPVVRRILPVFSDSTPEAVQLEAILTDIGGNVATVTRRIQVVAGPSVRLNAPAAGTVAPVGTPLRVIVQAYNPRGLDSVGFRSSGAIAGGAAVLKAGAPLNSVDTLALTVPAATALATADTITPYLVRSGVRIFGRSAVVSFGDSVAPVASVFLKPVPDTIVTSGDSLLIRLRVRDNRGVVSVNLRGLARRGVDSLGTLQLIPRFTAQSIVIPPSLDTTLTRFLMPVASDSTAESVWIVADVADAAGNLKRDSVRIQISVGPFVQVNTPPAGLQHPVGTTLNVTIQGYDPRTLAWLGYTARGAVPQADSVAVSPAAASATRTLAWAVPAAAALGPDTLVPFAINAAGGRFVGAPRLIAFADTVRPTVTIDTPAVANLPVNVGDSVYVRVHVRDNRGVTRLVLTGTAQRGSAALGTDTTVTRFASKTVTLPPAADTVITRYLYAVPGDSTSEIVTLTALATDSSGNGASGTATIRMVSGPTLTIVRPLAGTLTSAGKKLVVEVLARDPNGIRLVGWRATGVVNAVDSLFYSATGGVQPKTASFVDTLHVPAGVTLGAFTITPFGVDSLGDPSGVGAGITVSVQSAIADTTAPTVTFVVSRRIETSDSITVSATDPSGIGSLAWRATKLGDTLTVYGSGSTGALPGTASDVRATFAMNLVGITQYPTQVVVRASATDSSGARTGIAVAETLTVVAGRTYALPVGSNIGDAVFNPNRQELYLSNTALDRIEVFSLASSSFVASIPVGSRPVGLALWPSDTTTLANADTLIVANSGGTNLSIVDLVTRVEKQRYRLPNYVIQKVKGQKDPATGNLRLTITEYDYADRPQFVAAVCRRPGARPNCGDVIVLYSTTPTPGQVGFPGRGYLAWENLSSTATDGTKGHFFWEQAAASLVLTTDTLQIISVRDSVSGAPVRSTLLGAGVGQIVDFNLLQFQDSTFVRNSGNFLRALVGEGGTNEGYARVMAFDPTPGTVTITSSDMVACTAAGLVCTGTMDPGISDAVFVRDFIVNRASRVSSIAINQNGRTMLVRADSIYAFNQTLGQTGLMPAGSGAVGMDFHPSNDFDANLRGTGGLGGTGSPNNRLVFAARPDSSIDVFDTFFYGEVTDNTGTTIPVPIRNSLIGPVRAATNGGNTLLFGLTAFGLVQVQLPSITNSLFPTARPIASAPAPASVPRIVSSGLRPSGRDPSPPRE